MVLGTHPLRNRYDASSRLVRSLARPCWSISNRGDRWRRVVYEWLHERDAFEAVAQTGMAVTEARAEVGSARVLYGNVAVKREKGFFSARDGIFNFEDYEKNECWICQNPAEHWDIWLACRHTFCERCSSEMLRRQMPCPLCRVRSGHVLRRSARTTELQQLGVAQDVEHEGLIETDLPGGIGRYGTYGARGMPRARSPGLVPQPQQLPPSQEP